MLVLAHHSGLHLEGVAEELSRSHVLIALRCTSNGGAAVLGKDVADGSNVLQLGSFNDRLDLCRTFVEGVYVGLLLVVEVASTVGSCTLNVVNGLSDLAKLGLECRETAHSV